MSNSVLVLEESDAVQGLIASALEESDVAVYHEHQPDHFLTTAQQLQPDLIFISNSDHKQEYAVCQQLHQDTKLGNTPLILLANARDQLNNEILTNLGIKGHLRKPFEAASLQEQIRQFLPSAFLTTAAEAYEQAQEYDSDDLDSELQISVIDEDVVEMLHADPTSPNVAEEDVPEVDFSDDIDIEDDPLTPEESESYDGLPEVTPLELDESDSLDMEGLEPPSSLEASSELTDAADSDAIESFEDGATDNLEIEDIEDGDEPIEMAMLEDDDGDEPIEMAMLEEEDGDILEFEEDGDVLELEEDGDVLELDGEGDVLELEETDQDTGEAPEPLLSLSVISEDMDSIDTSEFEELDLSEEDSTLEDSAAEEELGLSSAKSPDDGMPLTDPEDEDEDEELLSLYEDEEEGVQDEDAVEEEVEEELLALDEDEEEELLSLDDEEDEEEALLALEEESESDIISEDEIDAAHEQDQILLSDGENDDSHSLDEGDQLLLDDETEIDDEENEGLALDDDEAAVLLADEEDEFSLEEEAGLEADTIETEAEGITKETSPLDQLKESGLEDQLVLEQASDLDLLDEEESDEDIVLAIEEEEEEEEEEIVLAIEEEEEEEDIEELEVSLIESEFDEEESVAPLPDTEPLEAPDTFLAEESDEEELEELEVILIDEDISEETAAPALAAQEPPVPALSATEDKLDILLTDDKGTNEDPLDILLTDEDSPALASVAENVESTVSTDTEISDNTATGTLTFEVEASDDLDEELGFDIFSEDSNEEFAFEMGEATEETSAETDYEEPAPQELRPGLDDIDLYYNDFEEEVNLDEYDLETEQDLRKGLIDIQLHSNDFDPDLPDVIATPTEEGELLEPSLDSSSDRFLESDTQVLELQASDQKSSMDSPADQVILTDQGVIGSDLLIEKEEEPVIEAELPTLEESEEAFPEEPEEGEDLILEESEEIEEDILLEEPAAEEALVETPTTIEAVTHSDVFEQDLNLEEAEDTELTLEDSDESEGGFISPEESVTELSFDAEITEENEILPASEAPETALFEEDIAEEDETISELDLDTEITEDVENEEDLLLEEAATEPALEIESTEDIAVLPEEEFSAPEDQDEDEAIAELEFNTEITEDEDEEELVFEVEEDEEEELVLEIEEDEEDDVSEELTLEAAPDVVEEAVAEETIEEEVLELDMSISDETEAEIPNDTLTDESISEMEQEALSELNELDQEMTNLEMKDYDLRMEELDTSHAEEPEPEVAETDAAMMAEEPEAAEIDTAMMVEEPEAVEIDTAMMVEEPEANEIPEELVMVEEIEAHELIEEPVMVETVEEPEMVMMAEDDDIDVVGGDETLADVASFHDELDEQEEPQPFTLEELPPTDSMEESETLLDTSTEGEDMGTMPPAAPLGPSTPAPFEASLQLMDEEFSVPENNKFILQMASKTMSTATDDLSNQLGKVLEEMISTSVQKSIQAVMPDLVDAIVQQIKDQSS